MLTRPPVALALPRALDDPAFAASRKALGAGGSVDDVHTHRPRLDPGHQLARIGPIDLDDASPSWSCTLAAVTPLARSHLRVRLATVLTGEPEACTIPAAC